MKGITGKKRVLWSAVLVVTLLLAVGLAAAAGEMLPQSLVSSGGGQVDQEGLTLHSAVGQPVVGAVESGSTLCSGFLCGADAPQVSSDDDYPLYLPAVSR